MALAQKNACVSAEEAGQQLADGSVLSPLGPQHLLGLTEDSVLLGKGRYLPRASFFVKFSFTCCLFSC